MTPLRLRDVHVAYVNAVKEFAGERDAGREAGMVIEHLTGLTRAAQVISGHGPFEGDPARLDKIIQARKARQPLAQILGLAPFRDRLFRVTPDVLIPRADTEVLVDAALAVSPRRILDLGTGPGTIALTLLAQCPQATAVATDISQPALKIARENAMRLGVTDRVEFIHSDWFHAVNGAFDLIVSNPPYIDATTYTTLAPEITQWEPEIALTPGGDGLEAYRIIAACAPAHLARGGHLMVEIGFDQGRAVADLLQTAGLEHVRLTRDLNGKDRVVSGNTT